ncbi:MAG TPA: hypothetical protein VG013_12760 [Gemmataceae bacterium]|nr:hypothetical protein [Gemmataceae bacterium]
MHRLKLQRGAVASGGIPMQLIGSSLGTLVVAMIYYAYRDRTLRQDQRVRMLRERVTYMLWIMATHVN